MTAEWPDGHPWSHAELERAEFRQRQESEENHRQLKAAIFDASMTDEEFLRRWPRLADYERRIRARVLRRWGDACASDLEVLSRMSRIDIMWMTANGQLDIDGDLASSVEKFTKIHNEEWANRLWVCDECVTPTSNKPDYHRRSVRCIGCQASADQRHSLPSNPPAGGFRSAINRARAAGLRATLTRMEWEATVANFNDRCAYCGGPWRVVEHASPISRGGGTTACNCLPACDGCNSRKGSSTIEELLGAFWWEDQVIDAALKWLQNHGRSTADQET